MTHIVFVCIIAWHVIGFVILGEYENSSIVYDYRKHGLLEFLNPFWIYNHYKLNFFGTFLLMLLFNMLCPLLSAIYWIVSFIKWICTVGRKDLKER